MGAGHRRRPRLARADARRGALPPVTAGERHQVAIDALWEGGFLYACGCTREEIDARTRANATPGYDRHCRDLGLGREGRPLRFRTPPEGETVVRDVIRGEVVFPNRALDDFVCVKSDGHPLFSWPTPSTTATWASPTSSGERISCPPRPGVSCCGGHSTRPVRGRRVGARSPSCRSSPTSRSWSTNRARSSPSARTRWPSRATGTRGSSPTPSSTTWRFSGGARPGTQRRSTGPRSCASSASPTCTTHRRASTSQKLTHLNGEYIRDLADDRFIAAARPWVDPGPGVGPGRGRAAMAARARFDPVKFARLAPLVRERVATLGEVPAMVDFVFLSGAPVDERSWEKAIGRDALASATLAAALEVYARLRMVGRGARRGHPGPGRAPGAQAGQGPGAHPGGRHRPHRGPATVRIPGGPRAATRSCGDSARRGIGPTSEPPG